MKRNAYAASPPHKRLTPTAAYPSVCTKRPRPLGFQAAVLGIKRQQTASNAVRRSAPEWGRDCAIECTQRSARFAAAATVMQHANHRNEIRNALDQRYLTARAKECVDHACKEVVRYDREARRMHASLLEAKQTIEQMKAEYEALKQNHLKLLQMVRAHKCTGAATKAAHVPITSY